MAKARKREGISSKRKKATITPIARTCDGAGVLTGPEPYEILDRLVAECRPDLVQVKISLCWKAGWKIDRDGHLKAGKACKPNEVSRALMEFDAVILLNEELWPHLTPRQKEELVFHEMEHLVVEMDEHGEEKRDEKGRICVRCRHHDIEEFHSVRERYGEENLQSAAAAILEIAKAPLFEPKKKKDKAKDAA